MADTYSSVNRGSPLPAAVRGEWDDASDALTELRECSRLGCLPTFREAGMEPRALLAVNAELRVVVGDRSPGTPVPMLAAMHGERIAWSRIVPPTDRSRRRTNAPPSSSTCERTCITSPPSPSSTVAAGGRRRARGAFGDVVALHPVQDRLYVAQQLGLRVLDRETGAERLSRTLTACRGASSS